MHTPQMLRNMTFEELEQYSKTFDDVPQEVVRELLLKINHKQYDWEEETEELQDDLTEAQDRVIDAENMFRKIYEIAEKVLDDDDSDYADAAQALNRIFAIANEGF